MSYICSYHFRCAEEPYKEFSMKKKNDLDNAIRHGFHNEFQLTAFWSMAQSLKIAIRNAELAFYEAEEVVLLNCARFFFFFFWKL